MAQWLACWAHNPKVRGSKPRSAIALLGVLSKMRQERIELQTLGLWDLRAANCATAAASATSLLAGLACACFAPLEFGFLQPRVCNF